MNLDRDSRLRDIIIKLDKIYGTTYIVDEFHIPHDIVEQYSAYYKDKHIAVFWISNNMLDSIQLLTPMDRILVEYIFGEMDTRKFTNANKN